LVERHAPAPSQAIPEPAQVSSGAPRGTALHVPALPATSHAWQLPPQALPQQTPSAQMPLAHSFAAVHAAASAFSATHAPDAQ
jgi:hypothetical protein